MSNGAIPAVRSMKLLQPIHSSAMFIARLVHHALTVTGEMSLSRAKTNSGMHQVIVFTAISSKITAALIEDSNL